MKIKPWKLIGLLILAYLAWLVDWHRLGQTLAQADPWLLAAAAMLNAPIIWLKAARWRKICLLQGLSLTARDAFIYYLASSYIAFITPGRLGEAAKAAYLRQGHGASWGLALAGVLADRAFDVYLLAVLALAGLGWWGNWTHLAPWAKLGLFLSLAAPLAALAALKFSRIRLLAEKALGRLPAPAWASRGVKDFGQALTPLISFSGMLPPGLYTAAGYGFFFLECWLLSAALGLGIGFFELIPVMCITNMASYLPISVSGLGTREASLWLLLQAKGISLAQVFSFSMAILAVTYVITGLMGFCAFWARPISMKALKKKVKPQNSGPAP